MTDLQVQQATPHSTLEQAPALNPAKVAQLVNNFVLSTSRFLNSFVQNADVKLAKVSSKISNVETMMAILEAKLASVPNVDPASKSEATSDASAPALAQQEAPAAQAPEGEASSPAGEPTSGTEESSTAIVPAADPNQIAISKHPDYVAFFKQLKVGAPLPAIQMKVSAAGLDPSMMKLEPDTLVPYEGGGGEEGEGGEAE